MLSYNCNSHCITSIACLLTSKERKEEKRYGQGQEKEEMGEDIALHP